MFRKAQRAQAKLRIALCGVSGSGKTYSALKLAQGLGGKIAMLDTECGSGELYSDIADYDVVQVEAPYCPERYVKIIREAESSGYNVLIIDSLSHAWSGSGGVLEMLDNKTKASRSQNSFNAWKDITPEQNKLVEAILTSKMHVIATMRCKSSYQMVEENRNGKNITKPVKMGLAPIQREGIDYEFTVALDISVDSHMASASKDRTGLFDNKAFVIDKNTGKELLEWANNGVSLEDKATEAINYIKNVKQIETLESFYKTIVPERFMKDEDLRGTIIKACSDKKLDLQNVKMDDFDKKFEVPDKTAANEGDNNVGTYA